MSSVPLDINDLLNNEYLLWNAWICHVQSCYEPLLDAFVSNLVALQDTLMNRVGTVMITDGAPLTYE